MKKLLLFVAMLVIMLPNLNAQSEINLTKKKRRKNRIEGGVNVTNHKGKIDDLRVEFESGTAFQIGLYREWQFNQNFYLLYGAGFKRNAFKGVQFVPGETKAMYKEDIRESAITVPLRVGYNYTFNKSAIEYEIGLYYGRILSSKLKAVDIHPDYTPPLMSADLIKDGNRNVNEFGISSRLAYIYNDRFVIFIEGNNALTTSIIFPQTNKISTLRSVETVIGLGIRF